MTQLAVATLAFLATHFVASTPLRPALVRSMGEWPYRALYSLVALATLAWMAVAYSAAPRELLWPGLRHLPSAVMPFAFVLIACGFWRNPTIVGADKLLKSDDPARGIIRITRHPIMWGFILWAAAHLLARGDTKSLVFFGSFLLLAGLGTLLMDSRKKSNPDWPRFAGLTSNIPFVAIAQGRNRMAWREIGWLRPLAGIAVFVAVFFLHPWLFGVAAAQGYPSKPLRMLVGFPPGGANDLLARIVAQKLGESLGQPVVVENRPGASGVIAAEALARATPDGYTLMLGSTGTNTIAPALNAKLPYDPVRDLAPVGLVGIAASALVVNAQVPAQNVAELIALARSRPGKLTYASSGNGTTLHLGGELFKLLAGVDLVHVPYKGNAQALNDVAGGQVDLIFSALPPALPLARAGRVRILGVGMPERLRSAPELPTIAEQGVPGYAMWTWYGVFATGGAPAEAIERLSRDLRAALADGKVREQIVAQGAEPSPGTPAELRALVAAELEKWARVVKSAGIKAE
jgi:tripartite-type tricarboxylate transporter receptor subunit TctC